MRKLCTTVALALACLSLLSEAALGADGAKVIADCNANARLTQSYTIGELRSALSTMPADVKEYTNCYDVVQHALLAQLGGSHGGSGASGGSGGSFLPGWLIVVLVLLALGGLTLGAIAVRRRSANP